MYKTGTDTSIQTCRAEGYIVVEYSSKKDEKSIDKDKYFEIKQSNPEAWPKGFYNRRSDLDQYYVNDSKSFNDLVEILNANYKNISSFADYENCPPQLENPTIFDYRNLASDLVGYYGNHYFSR